jgi:hypothetical protein
LECEQELGLCVAPERIVYLAFARELGRLGKPQFFFMLDMLKEEPRMLPHDLEAAWHIYAVDYEVTELMFLEERDARIVAGPHSQDRAKLLGGGRVSEELRMNLALALDYVDQASKSSRPNKGMHPTGQNAAGA